MGHAPGIGLVLHARRDPGPVLDEVGAWARSHGSRLLMRPADAARWDGDRDEVTDAELAEQPGAVVSLGGRRSRSTGRCCAALEAGGAHVRLMIGCGQVVRLESDRHQRRNQVKLSLLDLPFLPAELRELAPGSFPGAPRPARVLEP